MKALIYKPSKSVTQSGSKKTDKWILEFSRSSSPTIDPLMKWTSSTDTQNQVKMKFSSKDLAVTYAEKNSIEYRVKEPKKSKIAIATLKMPDGKEVEIPLPPKVFKTGREGFYAQISAFVYDDEVYGGQIQVWKKTPKKDD